MYLWCVMTTDLQLIFAAFAHVIHRIYRHVVTIAVATCPALFTKHLGYP